MVTFERRSGLVGDEELRRTRERHGDHDALAHTARELVWVVVHALFGRGDAHQTHEFDRAVARLLLVHALVLDERLGNLIAAGEHRVERRHGLLENHGDLVAANLAHLLARELEEVFPLEQHLSRDLRRRDVQKPHNGERGHALAAAGFSHDAHTFALTHREAHVVDRTEHAVIGMESDGQAVDVEQFVFHTASCRIIPGDRALGRSRHPNRRPRS